jgi:ribosomal-protein-alanine N-acetyltransferase
MVPQPELRTRRLTLRRFVADDAAAVFAYARNPRVTRYTTFRPHESVADAEGFIRMVQGYETGHCWAIREAGGEDVIGAVEFQLEDAATASVHYVLAEEYWNRGIMTEVVQEVLRWGFTAFVNLARVRTVAAAANVGSRRVLEKAGLRFECLGWERWDKLPEPIEVAWYVVDRDEWDALAR